MFRRQLVRGHVCMLPSGFINSIPREFTRALGPKGLKMARSGQEANFCFGQEHRTFLSVNEFPYLTHSRP